MNNSWSVFFIVNRVQQIVTIGLITLNNCILPLILGNHSTYLFELDRKNESTNVSSSSTAVLLKLNTLHSLKTHIRSVLYNTYH